MDIDVDVNMVVDGAVDMSATLVVDRSPRARLPRATPRNCAHPRRHPRHAELPAPRRPSALHEQARWTREAGVDVNDKGGAHVHVAVDDDVCVYVTALSPSTPTLTSTPTPKRTASVLGKLEAVGLGLDPLLSSGSRLMRVQFES